jgi:hypothetical protein
MYERLSTSFLIPTACYCTDEFIEQIINGKKRIIAKKDILAQQMPHLPELGLASLLEVWGTNPDMAIVLPDWRPKTITCGWAYFWDVFNTVFPGAATHLLSQIKKVRKESGFTESQKPGNVQVAAVVAQSTVEPKLSLKGLPSAYIALTVVGAGSFKITESGPADATQAEIAKASAPPSEIIALLKG